MAGVASNWSKLARKLGRKKRRPGSGGEDAQQNKTKNKKKKQKTKHPGADAATAGAEAAESKQAAPLTPVLAMDCEMVGLGDGGQTDCLARMSIVNSSGEVVYDKYVLPPVVDGERATVTDYRTFVSGIEPHHLRAEAGAVEFKTAQEEACRLLKSRVLVGHSIDHDLSVLMVSHPLKDTRDTAHYKEICPKRPRALKALVKDILGTEVQTSQHDSVEDARAALALYKHFRKSWERKVRDQLAGRHAQRLYTVKRDYSKHGKKKQRVPRRNTNKKKRLEKMDQRGEIPIV